MTLPSHKMFVCSVLQSVQLDVVFLHEVKSVGFELRNKMNYCWNGPFWTLEHCQESGGVVIALSSTLQSFVVASSSNSNDRCVLVTLLIQDHVVGLRVVYASNLNSKRCKIWIGCFRLFLLWSGLLGGISIW
jgi:hypothetical protein